MHKEFPSLYKRISNSAGEYLALSGKHRCSVAIVGGGLTGLATALELSGNGISTIVLDAHQPGFGASGRNGGQVNPGWKHAPAEIERQSGIERAAAMIRFAHGAPDHLFSLVSRLGINCDARQNGTIRAATTDSGLTALHSLFNDYAGRSMPVELLSSDEIAAMTGTTRYLGGLIDRRGGDVNPLELVKGLARAVVSTGGKVYGESRVLELKCSGGGWSLRTNGGEVHADKVLLATNGYTDALWPSLAQSIVPVFGAVAATEPLPASLSQSILPHRGSLFENGLITVYYRVDMKNRLVIGGRGPMHQLRNLRELGHITSYAQKLWPALSHSHWAYFWNGQLAMTKDAWPHLCELAPGVWSCLGYNGRGVALSVALGSRLGALLAGAERSIELPVTPLKKIPFHPFWPVGVAWHVALGRLRDKFGL